MALTLPRLRGMSHHKLCPFSSLEMVMEVLAAGGKEATFVAYIFITILSLFPYFFHLCESSKSSSSSGVLLFPICLNDFIFILLLPSPQLPFLKNACFDFRSIQKHCSFPFLPLPFPCQGTPAFWDCLRSSFSSICTEGKEANFLTSGKKIF